MLRMSTLVCARAVLAGSLVLARQEQPIFKSTVRTVPVYATVIDTSGRLVPDLEQTDFSVLDNGKPADIALFSSETPMRITTPRTPAPCRS